MMQYSTETNIGNVDLKCDQLIQSYWPKNTLNSNRLIIKKNIEATSALYLIFKIRFDF